MIFSLAFPFFTLQRASSLLVSFGFLFWGGRRRESKTALVTSYLRLVSKHRSQAKQSALRLGRVGNYKGIVYRRDSQIVLDPVSRPIYDSLLN